MPTVAKRGHGEVLQVGLAAGTVHGAMPWALRCPPGSLAIK